MAAAALYLARRGPGGVVKRLPDKAEAACAKQTRHADELIHTVPYSLRY